MHQKRKVIVLISCSSKKLSGRMKAKDLYNSDLFQSSLDYANSIKHDKIYILSAKYHLLDLETEIEPYNVTLSYISPKDRQPDLIILNNEQKKFWSNTVVSQLKRVSDIENDFFIILAGKEYVEPLKKSIKNLDNKLIGLRNGERLQWLKRNKSI